MAAKTKGLMAFNDWGTRAPGTFVKRVANNRNKAKAARKARRKNRSG